MSTTVDNSQPMPLQVAQATTPPATAKPATGAVPPGGVVPGAPGGDPAQAAAFQLLEDSKKKIADTFTASMKKLDGITDVEQLQQGTIMSLSEASAQAGKNAAEIAATGNQAAATAALNAQQALIRFMQEVQGMFMDIRILPFKLLSAFARGIGLTVLQ